jgi:sugar phosphate permease
MSPYPLCMRTIINKDDTHVTLSIYQDHAQTKDICACFLTLGDVAFLAFSISLAISSLALCVIAEQGFQVSMWTPDEATINNNCTNI